MPFLSHLSAWLICESCVVSRFHESNDRDSSVRALLIGRGYRVAVGACPWPCAPFVDRNSILVHRNSHSLVPYPVLAYRSLPRPNLAYRSALVIYTG